MKKKEIKWSWVPGYVGLYKISTAGQVISFHRSSDGKPLKTQVSQQGYITAALRRNKESRSSGVHHWMLLAFAGNPKKGQQARHLNGRRDDNRIENLCWGSAKENAEDRDRHGTTARGERNSLAKLTDLKVAELRDLYASGSYTFTQLAVKFGLQKAHVARAVRGVTWKHVKHRDEYKPQARANDRKLNNNLAVEIRTLFSTGKYSVKRLADKYGVKFPTVVNIVRGKYYADAGGPNCSEVRRRDKLTEAKAEQIRALYATGKYTQTRLSERFGITRQAVSRVVLRQTWNNTTTNA